MKTFTKLISLLIAVMMVFALALPTFAVDETKPTYTLTINGQEPGHTYEAYQVFAGVYTAEYKEETDGTGAYYKTHDGTYVEKSKTTLNESNYSQYEGGTPVTAEDGTVTYTAKTYTMEKILSNITWGNGVDSEGLLNELKGITAGDLFDKAKNASRFADCTDANSVADVVKKFYSDSDQIDAFADIVAKHLTKDSAKIHTSTFVEGSEYVYKIIGLEAGYYFVKDKNFPTDADQNNVYTKYMLDVVGDLEIEAKADKPTLEKYIIDEDGNVKANSVSVGEKVYYKLESNVPNMDGYKSYTFRVVDTMSKGLEFNEETVVVKIGDTTLTRVDSPVTAETNKENTYTVVTEPAANGETIITIEVLNFYENNKNNTGKPIVVTYDATVTADAVIGNTGNVNKAHLVYTKDPNDQDPTHPEGQTPESETYTFVTKIKLHKVDENGKPLTGAQFKITGKKVITNIEIGKYYVEDENGDWYKLAAKDENGKDQYTQTAPTPETEADYASITVKYRLVEYVNENKGENTVDFTSIGWVDENGNLVFTGLGEGTYIIEEITTPDGYNTIPADIEVVITCTPTETDPPQVIWTVTENGTTVMQDEDGYFAFEVINKKGTNLPTTGGIGTTIFYVLGGILAVGAVVLLVTKKRMREDV